VLEEADNQIFRVKVVTEHDGVPVVVVRQSEEFLDRLFFFWVFGVNFKKINVLLVKTYELSRLGRSQRQMVNFVNKIVRIVIEKAASNIIWVIFCFCFVEILTVQGLGLQSLPTNFIAFWHLQDERMICSIIQYPCASAWTHKVLDSYNFAGWKTFNFEFLPL
jgi:hypothetical protein